MIAAPNDIAPQGGAFLHGVFTLADGVTEQSFLPTLHAFYGHLAEQGYVCGYRITRRVPLDGFGAKLLAFDYHIEIAFPSPAHDQACYEYVKRDEEPIRSLHRAMNTQVKRGSADFFLTVPLADQMSR